MVVSLLIILELVVLPGLRKVKCLIPEHVVIAATAITLNLFPKKCILLI